MTTSVVNNSVFRGFFEKQKLTGPNFNDWYIQLKIVLSVEDKLNYPEHPIPAAPIPAHVEKYRQSRASGAPRVTWPWSESRISLRTEFDGFVQNYNMHSMGKTINELHSMLKLHEQTLPNNNAPVLHAIRAVKGLRGSRKLKPCALSLYVGNGQRATVEAIRSYHLSLPRRLVIVLNNCHYAPSITREIISDSHLYDDGYVNRFMDNLIQVSRNNMVYFSVVPRDGIFKIDLSDSYTNVSSMYALSNKRAKSNLDSALLWHCRLGHISKKYIEKLQHDGLLNLTDLRAFVKCIPCMFEKMARKPYTQQVDRAKDLLRLIHTDVCGPFKIVSRQEASYFVTFTDDFSLYGYVYLLKHKHEVLETFKVFQKEVENKLGYPKETMGYSFYYLPENKVLVARNAEFLENSLIAQEASGNLEDLEIIQEEDTHPSIDTSLHHEEDNLDIDEPQRDLGELTNYKAVLLDLESNKWLNAMNVEMKCMKDNKVWDLVDLPPNVKTVSNKWLFKKKTDMDGAVHTYKARLVAKGYTQNPMIDYEETFSHVADIRAIRILKAIDAFYDYEIWQMDVKTAFLNGYLFEEVYMERPEGFVNSKISKPNVKSYLGRCFAMKDLSEAAYILGIKIYRDRSRQLIGLCQSAYVEKILKRYHIKNSKRRSIYMQDKLSLSKSQGASTHDELNRMQNVPYALIVGSIMYAMRCTCPDVAFAQNITSRFQQNPEAEYIAAYDASKEAIWVRKFIYGLGVVPTIKEPISMYCDNTEAITITNESGITKGARHFRAKVHYLREVIEYGDIKLKKSSHI
nr:hypothetical protein [Tanacetum cinerariifolium]